MDTPIKVRAEIALRPWIHLVREVVLRMPERFSLHDLDVNFDTFRQAYLNNKNVDAKVRQTLQRLRDEGTIAFHGAGHYERLLPRADPSVLIDFQNAAHFKSASQRARIALETWAKLNLWCSNCGNPSLIALPPNAPVADLRCFACSTEFQLKSKNGFFSDRILGAALGPLKQRAREKNIPDYLLIEYDVRVAKVVRANLIKGADLTVDRIIGRSPTKSDARRPGWVGRHINIAGLKQTPIVGPAFMMKQSSILREPQPEMLV